MTGIFIIYRSVDFDVYSYFIHLWNTPLRVWDTHLTGFCYVLYLPNVFYAVNDVTYYLNAFKKNQSKLILIQITKSLLAIDLLRFCTVIVTSGARDVRVPPKAALAIM